MLQVVHVKVVIMMMVLVELVKNVPINVSLVHHQQIVLHAPIQQDLVPLYVFVTMVFMTKVSRSVEHVPINVLLV